MHRKQAGEIKGAQGGEEVESEGGGASRAFIVSALDAAINVAGA